MWPHIQSTIEEKLHRETKIKYKNLDKKINQLTKTQTKTPLKPQHFNPESFKALTSPSLIMKQLYYSKDSNTTYTQRRRSGYSP